MSITGSASNRWKEKEEDKIITSPKYMWVKA